MTATHDHSGYDRLLEDFGQTLQESTERSVRGGHGVRRAAGGGLALAGLAAGALLLGGTGGTARLGVVAQAKGALAPVGHVVHLVTTSHMEMRGGSQAEIVGPEGENNTPRVTARWSASEPTRWRVAATVPSVTANGTHLERVQRSYGRGVEEIYLQSLNRLELWTGVSEDSLQARLSGGPLGTDPVARIRAMLEAGQLHDAGRGTVDGHTVERLTGDESSLPQDDPHPPWPVEYDVDPTTYAPVRLSVEEAGTKFPGNTGTPTQIVEIDSYEQLPLTGATAALLSIHPLGNPTVSRHIREG